MLGGPNTPLLLAPATAPTDTLCSSAVPACPLEAVSQVSSGSLLFLMSPTHEVPLSHPI